MGKEFIDFVIERNESAERKVKKALLSLSCSSLLLFDL